MQSLSVRSTGNGVTIAWEEPEDADFAGVEISCVPPDMEPVRITAGNREAVITELTNGREYLFTVRSCDSRNTMSPGRSISATPGGRVMFVSGGTSFSPVLTLEGPASVLWTWSDGSTDTRTAPVKHFGSAGERTHSLRVTPWSALRRINIGYDGLDGGSLGDSANVPDQNVRAVFGLEVAAPWLREWCSSYNRIRKLDFTNFTRLETIECYRSLTLEEVVLRNTPALSRACFEDCALLALDLSESPGLRDLRGAENAFDTVSFGSGAPDARHICIRDNSRISRGNLFGTTSGFPAIEELWIWNTNQRGALRVPSTGTSGTVSILASGNAYTSADFRGALRNPSAFGRIDLNDNSLRSLTVAGCTQLLSLEVRNNALSGRVITGVLRELDGLGRTGGYADFRGNAPPTAAGRTFIGNLERKGWTVLSD